MITKEWIDEYDSIVQQKLLPLSDVKIVRILNSVPQDWESLLTYSIDNKTYNFKIGDEVRISDVESETGYIYYKLYAVDNNKAQWAKLGTGGGNSLSATITINLEAYSNNVKNSGADLIGIIVTLSDGVDFVTSTLEAGQSSVRFTGIVPLKNYTVSVPQVTGYTLPASLTITNIDFAANETLTFLYFTDEYTIIITGLLNGTVSYNNTVYSNNNTFKVPTGTTVTVSDFTAAKIKGYKSSITLNGKTVTCVYEEFSEFVDLGLPSGRLWAVGNLVKDSQGNYSIGSETDWGTYVSWGNIDGHNEGEGYNFSRANYQNTPGYSLTASITSDDALHDIALARLGTPWNLPTKELCKELYDNTDSEWVANYNNTGVAGRKFMKKTDHSVYIFFPACGYYEDTSLTNRGYSGYYWSASYSSSTGPLCLYFYNSLVIPQSGGSVNRYGLTVRPVCVLTKNITLTFTSTDESSVENMSVTVTDFDGNTYSGTTDVNGFVTLQNVQYGTCSVRVQNRGLSTYSIYVSSNITSFAINCHEAAVVTSYIIDQSNTDASPVDYIVKDVAAMNSNDADDVIHRIWSNTKLYAAKTTLSSGKLMVRELSRNNKSQWTNGTNVVYNTSYDKFMKLPEFWWKCKEVSRNTDRWEISFTMNNPNNASWNHWEGNIFIGCYEAANVSNMVYSRKGYTPTGLVFWPNFRSYAAARGTGYTLVTYEAHVIMALLGYGWLGTTDDQSIVGYGGNEYNKVTGKCDAKGIHDTSAAVDGGNTAGGGSNISINFWGLENWWGNMNELVDNIQTANSSGLINILTPGSSTVNRTVQTTTGNSSDCITKIIIGDKGDMIPKAYVSDRTYSKGYASRGIISANFLMVACRSGNGSNAYGGLCNISLSLSTGNALSNFGSRLQYQGDWEEDSTLT